MVATYEFSIITITPICIWFPIDRFLKVNNRALMCRVNASMEIIEKIEIDRNKKKEYEKEGYIKLDWGLPLFKDKNEEKVVWFNYLVNKIGLVTKHSPEIGMKGSLEGIEDVNGKYIVANMLIKKEGKTEPIFYETFVGTIKGVISFERELPKDNITIKAQIGGRRKNGYGRVVMSLKKKK